MVGSLANLSELRESRFGQPFPRHGLSLLWWFANVFVDVVDRTGSMFTRYNPEDGSFGFHKFHNIERLLPRTYLTYYEVGNLSHRHHPQHTLPHTVTMYYDPNVPYSNKDRIIVLVHSSQNKVWLDKIYVTQHSDQTRFDQNRTYLIERKIIQDIKNLSTGEFLRLMKNDQNSQSIQVEPIQDSAYIVPMRDSTHIVPIRHSTHTPMRDLTPQHQPTDDGCNKCYCLMGCALILAIIVIFILIMLFFYT
ncbi:hypothetical protein E1301_Tti012129 [Triplophysa tibetana]|uniref:Uncharacterized protein n=1 Tax=Triplophysa tibetana TaxID=1572043 RepID=A0A5A9PJR8_9TELE|nr:hypothetical protein E1301_Tti012129 [Triplophysa tibetana]